MSEPAESPGTRQIITPTRVVAGLCLLAPFIAMLWVGSYAKLEPTLIGIPFFYWYQMLWVLISTGLTTVAYKLVQREKRAAKGGAAK
ncbi:DUF3311 domain-containing protein [Streptomyces sp. NPDC050636]|uniref:DUF3311 domain-containing protein n=1 Tax=Streptomyces sp. NPDC050636 TaxID=3154510 RepID=UPI00344A3D3A